jgi:hypothetical protein
VFRSTERVAAAGAMLKHYRFGFHTRGLAAGAAGSELVVDGARENDEPPPPHLRSCVAPHPCTCVEA